MNNYEIILRNKRIYDFYEKHKLPPEYANLVFIETLEKLNASSCLFDPPSLTTILLQKPVSNINSNFNSILLSLFPCSQIERQTEDTYYCVVRDNKDKLLIENKDCESNNVNKNDVDTFIQNCEKEKCCGILFSQYRGIASKSDFELQILNNKHVLLYVHKTNFDIDKIKTAFDIVDNFKSQLDKNEKRENTTLICNDVLKNINDEYIQFKNQKLTILKIVKDFNDKMVSSINDLKLPQLDNYLIPITNTPLGNNSLPFPTEQSNACNYCGKHIPKSMLQHLRHCKSKNVDTVEKIVNVDKMIS